MVGKLGGSYFWSSGNVALPLVFGASRAVTGGVPAQSRVNAKELYKLTASGQFADADVDAESSPRRGSRIIAFIFGFISTMGGLVYLKNMSWSAALSPSNHYLSYQPDLDRDIFFYCLFIVIV